MRSSDRRALVVDDDPIQRQVLSAFLTGCGFSVLVADNGSAANVLLSEYDDIDLILTDLHMPEVDGIELIQHMKDSACNIPLVVISSATTPTVESAQILARAHRINLIGCLPKPIDFKKLGELLGLPPRYVSGRLTTA